MSNLEKVNEMLVKDPETAKKLAAEMKQLTESNEAADVKEAMAKSVKAVFGLDLTDEDVEAAMAKPEEAPADSKKMNLDELDQVAGGDASTLDRILFYSDVVLTGINIGVRSFYSPLGLLGEAYINMTRLGKEAEELGIDDNIQI